MKKRLILIIALILTLALSLCACSLDDLLGQIVPSENGGTNDGGTDGSNEGGDSQQPPAEELPPSSYPGSGVEGIPTYSGTPFAEVNGNIPTFTDADMTTDSFEFYSELDTLGRCGVTNACVGLDIMPADGEERGSISSVKPSGWQSVQYDIVDGKYLYNRCHLIGWQLTAENANKRNLITGTRYMNVDGMLPFENMIADYIKETENHVLLRVTPIFVGNELVARGVIMEAYSVEDEGDGISFNVYIYNVQPSVSINYSSGVSCLSGEELPEEGGTEGGDSNGGTEGEITYILNTNSKKFHKPTCGSVDDMLEANKEEYSGTREQLIAEGYSPCGSCDP